MNKLRFRCPTGTAADLVTARDSVAAYQSWAGGNGAVDGVTANGRKVSVPLSADVADRLRARVDAAVRAALTEQTSSDMLDLLLEIPDKPVGESCFATEVTEQIEAAGGFKLPA